MATAALTATPIFFISSGCNAAMAVWLFGPAATADPLFGSAASPGASTAGCFAQAQSKPKATQQAIRERIAAVLV
jgi:hypothetical protein